ncbi:pyridoxal phosphate-dependent aminotransferase [Terrihabitans sp. B22-R8]|uniref:pyridoxal phosphate-dependent aminotransferase n=1 Tax=Terrihabitans sp. B22-R8 TaxID=3425128 RepID=UPI00403CC774
MSDRQQKAHRLIHARRAEVAPFIAMDVASAASRMEQRGRRVVHMEIGEPGAQAPLAAREAAIRYISQKPVGYTSAMGLLSLRERIARHYSETHGISVSPSRIAVTTGSSCGFVLAFLSLFDPGQRIAIASPGYPPYRTILQSLGLIPVEIEVGPDSRWVLSGPAIAAAHSENALDGVLIMSPANPSGTIIDERSLADIVETCNCLGIRLISDEIYHGLTYALAAHTALKFSPDAVIVNSFSKYWCMTGWRVGWIIVPDELARPIERLAQNLFISAPTISQVAAEAAMDADDELAKIHASYARNRQRLLDELPAAGFTHFLPADGAFYLYADISHLTNDSTTFARSLLDETGVAATPGVDFDRERGHRFLRLSYAGSEADIDLAISQIINWRRSA